MALQGDERGVSALIGFILLFGVIVIIAAVWQAQVVPAENSKTEFEHYSAAEEDMSQLRSDFIDAAESGTTRSSAVSLGTEYPPRIIFMNPPSAQGTIRTEVKSDATVDGNGFSVSNVCGLDSPVETRSMTLNTRYSQLSESEAPPFVFENSVLYKKSPDGGVLFESDQTLLQGSTINLYPLTSSISQTGVGTKSIDFKGAKTGEVKVSGSLSVEIPTNLSAQQWETVLSDEPNFESAQDVSSSRVNLTLSDTSWTVQCAAVGAGTTPDVTDPANADAGDVDVGLGAVSDYSEGANSSTFSANNGRWIGITCTDQMILSNGQPASKPNANNLQGEVIRLTALLSDSTGEEYTMDIRLARATDGSWNTKEVIIYDGNDNNVNAELTAAAATRIYDAGETDMLQLSNYDGPDTGSGSFSDFVTNITALEDDAPVVWQTSRMIGRVEVALVCDPPPAPPASGVEAKDGTTPDGESSALEFDIQVAKGTIKNVTAVNITTPGNQNSDVQSANQLQRNNNPEVDLDVSNTNGLNKSGERSTGNIQLDGSNYDLETNATFSNGALLGVDMGDIENGNTKWTYDLTDSQSNADVVVTFFFQDGTKFEAYLRVTNVNN